MSIQSLQQTAAAILASGSLLSQRAAAAAEPCRSATGGKSLMARWVAPPPLELQLWYGDVLVADLHQVFPHQGTWFAPYELKIAPGEGALRDRLLEYIAFTEEFNRRIAEGQDHDFAELDGFGAIADAGSWRVPRPDGGLMPMAEGMWFVDGQASWQHPETAPSTEGAANELWARIAEYVAANRPGPAGKAGRTKRGT